MLDPLGFTELHTNNTNNIYKEIFAPKLYELLSYNPSMFLNDGP